MATSDYFSRLKSQRVDFTFTNSDGLTVSRLGISITLFFKQGYTLEKKHRILACYRRFREEFSTHLRFHRHALKGLKKYSPENIAKVEESILNQKKNQPSTWDIRGCLPFGYIIYSTHIGNQMMIKPRASILA